MSAPVYTPDELASIAFQKAHITDNRVPQILGVTWALWALSCIAVTLRFVGRRMLRANLQLEDYFILAALLMTLGLSVLNTFTASVGYGRHLILSTPQHVVDMAKCVVVYEYVYTAAVLFVKTSILRFYYKTFPNRKFRILVITIEIFVLLWVLYSFVCFTVQCIPLSYAWTRTGPEHCFDLVAYVVASSVLNAITDFVIVILPMPLVWGLQMPNSRRLAICGTFLLCGIVVVAGCIRLIFLKNLNAFDTTWENVDIAIWSNVETCLGIVCACLPFTGPVFRKVKAALFRSKREQTTRAAMSESASWGNKISSSCTQQPLPLPSQHHQWKQQLNNEFHQAGPITAAGGTHYHHEQQWNNNANGLKTNIRSVPVTKPKTKTKTAQQDLEMGRFLPKNGISVESEVEMSDNRNWNSYFVT